MICPNCKTELVEVNGRYICSDCGREIPENEVMASDWGNGGNTRAGLYGAGTDDLPEEGSKPISDYGASLSEAENEITPATAIVTDAPTEVAATPVAPEELSVEEILQEQATEAKTEPGFYTPPVDIEPAVAVLPAEPEPIPVSEMISPVTPVENVVTEATQEVPITVPEVAPVVEPEIVTPVFEDLQPPTPITTPEAIVPEIPAPEVVAPIAQPLDTIAEPVLAETVPEMVPEHDQVVTDMFESAYTSPATNDPGIFRDPMYEAVGTDSPVAENGGGSVRTSMSADKKTTMIVLISGVALTLLLIIGGIWAYVLLNAKVVPVVTPVVDEVTWQELQVIDAGFKASFPGTPEKAEELVPVNGTEASFATYTAMVGDASYSIRFVALDDTQAKAITEDLAKKLPLLVEEFATSIGLTVDSVKPGKYYTADAIDFTLSSDTAKYQGKVMVNENTLIVVLAGSESGQAVDYSKFIKSFSFINTEAAE